MEAALVSQQLRLLVLYGTCIFAHAQYRILLGSVPFFQYVSNGALSSLTSCHIYWKVGYTNIPHRTVGDKYSVVNEMKHITNRCYAKSFQQLGAVRSLGYLTYSLHYGTLCVCSILMSVSESRISSKPYISHHVISHILLFLQPWVCFWVTSSY